MLNEERIKLMTKMAAYEEKERGHSLLAGNYFRSDYISLQLLRSVVSATAAFIIVLCLFAFYDFEIVMKEMYQVDLLQMGKSLLLAYIIFTGVYVVISYCVYSYRYSRAKKSLKKYYAHLHRLSDMYSEDSKKERR